MMHRRGRSARGVEVETDPRFLAPPSPLGRDQRSANRGKLVTLAGSDIHAQSKLLRLAEEDSQSWLIAASSRFDGLAPGAFSQLGGVWAKGLAGSGGATVPVIFDVKPDTNIQLPGNSVDIDVAWAPTYRGTAAGIAPVEIAVLGTGLPAFAHISAIASKGGTARGRATCTQRFFTTFAGGYGITLPPFADEFMLFAAVASYANLTSVEFLTSSDVATANIISTYTGAQVEAIRNAGQNIQVPGMAVAILINTAGGFSGYATSYLSL